MNGSGTVLVSGGSGFIGSWCVISLLEAGYNVRTTVRDLRREGDVRAMVARRLDPGNRLSVVAANLASDEGWDAAAEGRSTSCMWPRHSACPRRRTPRT